MPIPIQNAPSPSRDNGGFTPIQSGFTLIELLVVMAVMSILVGVGITSFNYAQKKAKETKVQADFQAMFREIETRRSIDQKVLGDLTGDYCSLCHCDNRAPGVTSASHPTCVTAMNQSWTNATGKPMPKDPWGNPYSIDENENETYGNCGKDALVSAGPDGVFSTGDELAYYLPLSSLSNASCP